MQLAEDRVTVGVLRDQDEQPAEVAAAQLAPLEPDPVDGDEVPWPDEDFGADVRLTQDRRHLLGDRAERVARLRVARDQGAGGLVLLRVEDREDEVLQLRLEGLHAEPLGERDEDVAGDLGDPRLFLRPHHAEGAHVVQPVGEFDRHHPDVVAGGDEHLAEGLGLGRGAVVDLLDLGDAVDEVGDLVAELPAHLIERHLGVLDGVVEEGGGQSGGLRAEFGEDEGHRERMGDVRLAALAELAAVRGLGEDVRPAQHREVGLGMVGAVRLGHMADGVRQSVTGRRSRGGAEQGRPAQPAQVDPGASASADGHIGVGGFRRAHGIGGLCAHGAPPATSTGGGRARRARGAGA